MTTTASTPAGARPRFRTDLVAEPIQEGTQRFVDVFDPDSGRGFRFYEVEYSLACAMDGERDVASLARWAKEELGVEPSQRELATVISTLGDLGYLAGARADVGGLAPGVIAAAPAAAPAAEQFELGTAGGVAAAGGELPRAPEVELGQAGGVSSPRIVVDDFGTGPELGPSAKDEFPMPPSAAVPMATLRPSTIPDSDDGGPTDLPRPVPLAAGDEDVSTDLSDHLAISANDVKEAVRASKVMQAVELPADIAATLAAAEAEQEARAAAAAKAAAEQAAAEASAKAAAAKAAADQAAAAAAAKAAAEQAAAEAAARELAAQTAAREAQQQVRAAEPSALGLPGAEKKPEAETAKPEDKKPETKKPEAATATTTKDKAAATATTTKDKAAGATATTTKDKAAGATATTTKDKAVKPVEPPAEPRTSRALIALLILTILLAGAYLVWTQLLKKPLPWEKTETASTQPAQPTPPPAPPTPPAPPPPPPSAALTELAGAPTTVAAGQAGTIVEVVADGSTVAQGDQLARFVGNAGLEKRLAAGKKRLAVDLAKAIGDLTAKRDAALAAGKADAAKAWQDKLDKQLEAEKSLQAEVGSLTDQLAAFIVKAPLAGTVKTEVAKGAKITNIEQPIAEITAPPSLEAKFTLGANSKRYAIGDSLRVAPKDGPAKAVTCEVTAVDGPLTVKCPGGSMPAGTVIVILE